MLRMYLMQLQFNLSGAAIEDAIYDSYAMPPFMCIDSNQEYAPDLTTLLKFRYLQHQTKNGNQWYYGMKIHAGSGYVHTITATTANIHDVQETSKLTCDEVDVVYGDSRDIQKNY